MKQFQKPIAEVISLNVEEELLAAGLDTTSGYNPDDGDE